MQCSMFCCLMKEKYCNNVICTAHDAMAHIKISMMCPILHNEAEFMATQFNIFVLTCKGTENTRQGQKVFTPATRLFNALYNHEPNPSPSKKVTDLSVQTTLCLIAEEGHRQGDTQITLHCVAGNFPWLKAPLGDQHHKAQNKNLIPGRFTTGGQQGSYLTGVWAEPGNLLISLLRKKKSSGTIHCCFLG